MSSCEGVSFHDRTSRCNMEEEGRDRWLPATGAAELTHVRPYGETSMESVVGVYRDRDDLLCQLRMYGSGQIVGTKWVQSGLNPGNVDKFTLLCQEYQQLSVARYCQEASRYSIFSMYCMSMGPILNGFPSLTLLSPARQGVSQYNYHNRHL